jgi:hypothetical protein
MTVRPTVSEQLDGLRRILEEVVAPQLSDPYPVDILDGVCGTLAMLAAGWQQVPAFQRWDAEQTAQLLADVRGVLGPALEPELQVAIAGVVDAAPADPADLGALDRRQRAAREALVAAIPTIAGRDELAGIRARLSDLIRERAARYPLTGYGRPHTPPAPTS